MHFTLFSFLSQTALMPQEILSVSLDTDRNISISAPAHLMVSVRSRIRRGLLKVDQLHALARDVRSNENFDGK